MDLDASLQSVVEDRLTFRTSMQKKVATNSASVAACWVSWLQLMRELTQRFFVCLTIVWCEGGETI